MYIRLFIQIDKNPQENLDQEPRPSTSKSSPEVVKNVEAFPLYFPDPSTNRLSLLRELIQRQHSQRNSLELPDKFRLFHNGIELLDQDQSLSSQGIRHDDTIVEVVDEEEEGGQEHRTFQGDSPIDTSNNEVDQDEYYRVGDLVDSCDALDSRGWFPAQVVTIAKGTPTESQYFVHHFKPSLGWLECRQLDHLRPQPRTMIVDRRQLEVGCELLALIQDLWHACRVVKIVVEEDEEGEDQDSGQSTSKQPRPNLNDNGGCVWVERLDDPGSRIRLELKQNSIFLLERNVRLSERSEELDQVIRNGCKVKRFFVPDCDQCHDDPSHRECIDCGCMVCHGKTNFEQLLLCDDCQRPVHYGCLSRPPPLTLAKMLSTNEDWYCEECGRGDASSETSRSMSRTGHGNRQASKLATNFGAILGVPVGSWWRYRVQASEVGVHAPLVANVHGRLRMGAFSVVISLDDIVEDSGEEVVYLVRDGQGLKRRSTRCRGTSTTPTTSSSLTRRMLAMNCAAPLGNLAEGADSGPNWRDGKPIRVLRNGNGRRPRPSRTSPNPTPFMPPLGVRYDGLYKVVKYWREPRAEECWKFLLRRHDPGEPPPWTEAGRYQMRKLGLGLQYPRGWTRGEKRMKKLDDLHYSKQLKREREWKSLAAASSKSKKSKKSLQ